MEIHPLSTGRILVKRRQVRGEGTGQERMLNTLMDPNWTDPLPIGVWAIRHPKGVIVVDMDEVAQASSHPDYYPENPPFLRQGTRIEISDQDEVGLQLRWRLDPERGARRMVLRDRASYAGTRAIIELGKPR